MFYKTSQGLYIQCEQRKSRIQFYCFDSYLEFSKMSLFFGICFILYFLSCPLVVVFGQRWCISCIPLHLTELFRTLFMSLFNPISLILWPINHDTRAHVPYLQVVPWLSTPREFVSGFVYSVKWRNCYLRLKAPSTIYNCCIRFFAGRGVYIMIVS